jgi:diketogulonate reductase-like aldo/keto reductase
METRTLADGAVMPVLGLGVWQVREGPECERAVSWALEAGYRHIDTAQAYGNEASVGRALRASGIPREEVFVTTKFWPRARDPVAEAERSLERLGVEQVDLYIIHWPEGGASWAWPGMEEAQRRGFARSIGVSNFSVRELAELDAVASVAPVCDQVQFSAFEYRRALLAECVRREMALVAYSSLGTGSHLGSRAVREVAERVERTPAQVLLRWCVQKGTVVIPKSTHRERIEENARIFEFSLGAEEMGLLDALDRTGEASEARERRWWD